MVTWNPPKKKGTSGPKLVGSSLQQVYAYVSLDIPRALQQWGRTTARWMNDYNAQVPETQILEIVLDSAVFAFDLFHEQERVVFAYAVSILALTKRDGARIRGFPNVNPSVRATLGDRAFVADRGHFLGHASGGQLDINLFPHRRELNRGWSTEGKLFRTMEKYVTDNPGTFFYHRPIYDDPSWVPATLEYGVLKKNKVWCVETFANKLPS